MIEYTVSDALNEDIIDRYIHDNLYDSDEFERFVREVYLEGEFANMGILDFTTEDYSILAIYFETEDHLNWFKLKFE